jgi:hypothetical protein
MALWIRLRKYLVDPLSSLLMPSKKRKKKNRPVCHCLNPIEDPGL